MKPNAAPAERPRTPYGLISRYRAELMGFATLWVTFFHSPIRVTDWMPSILGRPIEIFRMLGYGGVDLFILVSGIGIYQSLSHNSTSVYIKNRVKRIYPIWVVFALLTFGIATFVLHKPYSAKEIVGWFTLFGHWSPAMTRQGNWYVYAIMLFYVIAPIPFALLRDSKRKAVTCAILVAIAVLGSTAFFAKDDFTIRHMMFAFSRLPLFIIGMFFSAALNKKEMKALDWIICIVLFLVGSGVLIYMELRHPKYCLYYGLAFYPFILIAPTMALLLSRLFCACEKPFRHWHAALRFLGKGSLEIFLVSNYVFKRGLAHKLQLNSWQAILFSLFALFAGIVFHLIMKYGTKGVTALYHKIKKPSP